MLAYLLCHPSIQFSCCHIERQQFIDQTLNLNEIELFHYLIFFPRFNFVIPLKSDFTNIVCDIYVALYFVRRKYTQRQLLSFPWISMELNIVWLCHISPLEFHKMFDDWIQSFWVIDQNMLKNFDKFQQYQWKTLWCRLWGAHHMKAFLNLPKCWSMLCCTSWPNS